MTSLEKEQGRNALMDLANGEEVLHGVQVHPADVFYLILSLSLRECISEGGEKFTMMTPGS